MVPHLISVKVKQKDGTLQTVWYWAPSASAKPFSPLFKRRKEAEEWMNNFIEVHQEMTDLLDRAKNGRFYTVRAVVNPKTIEEFEFPPFNLEFDAESGSVSSKILARDIEEAREKFSNYFEILEWLE